MEPVKADGVIPCGHVPHQYSAGTYLILTNWVIWSCGRAWLRTIRTIILQPYDRPQPAELRF